MNGLYLYSQQPLYPPLPPHPSCTHILLLLLLLSLLFFLFTTHLPHSAVPLHVHAKNKKYMWRYEFINNL